VLKKIIKKILLVLILPIVSIGILANIIYGAFMAGILVSNELLDYLDD